MTHRTYPGLITLKWLDIRKEHTERIVPNPIILCGDLLALSIVSRVKNSSVKLNMPHAHDIVLTLLWTHRGMQKSTFENERKCKLSSHQVTFK